MMQVPRFLKQALSTGKAQALWLERLLWAIGVVFLGIVAYAVIDARWYAWVQGRRLDEALRARRAAQRAQAGRGAVAGELAGGSTFGGNGTGGGRQLANQTDRLDTFRPATAPPAPPADEGSLLGRIEIPRLGVSSLVLEGVTAPTLRHGVGHIPGTALPQGPGNVGLAGHRDTVFRAVKDVREGDVITLDTLAGTYQYKVDWTQIVDPDDIAVLAASGRPELTLVTCYPFYYVGAAPRRFIVRAHQLGAAGDGPVAAPSAAGAGMAQR
jgi:sortase A